MCSSPHRVFKTGLKTDTGKDLLYFDCHYPCPDVVSLALAERNLKVHIPMDPKFVVRRDGRPFLYNFLDVPCGKCESCRLSNAKHWAYRCLMEASYYQDNFFVTLTFSDEFLPEKVSTKDLSMFMKNLRNRLGAGIRFFGCGEYGEKHGRSHYHVILFNCPIPDLYLVDSIHNLYGSKLLEECWPYGMVVVGAVSSASCAYVARYTSKKTGKKKGFVLMSRNPGIGYRFLVEHCSCVELDYIPILVDGVLDRITPPRYFERIFPDVDLTENKAKRVENMRARDSLLMFLHRMNRYQLDDYKRFLGVAHSHRLEKTL